MDRFGRDGVRSDFSGRERRSRRERDFRWMLYISPRARSDATFPIGGMKIDVLRVWICERWFSLVQFLEYS